MPNALGRLVLALRNTAWTPACNIREITHDLIASLFSSPLSTLGTVATLILKMVNREGNSLSPSKQLWTLLGWHPQDCVQSAQSRSPELELFPPGRGELFHPQPLSKALVSVAVCLWGLGTSLCQELLKPLFPYKAPQKFCPLVCSRLWREWLREAARVYCQHNRQPIALQDPSIMLPTNHVHTKDLPQVLLSEP